MGTMQERLRNSGTKRREHSKPGEVPKRWKNKSGRTIAEGKTQSKSILYTPPFRSRFGTSVILHASPHVSSDRVFQMLEGGGNQQVTYSQIVDNRTYRRDKLPGWQERSYKSFEERAKTSKNWESEQQAIRDYYSNVIKIKKVKTTARYEPRPFMMPAVKKLLPQFPKIWRTYIRKSYR